MKNIIFTIILALGIISCSHTNNLEKVDLSGKRILFEEKINGDIGQVEIMTSQSTPDTKKDKGLGVILSSALEVVNAAGEVIATSLIEDKLNNAANPKEIAYSVSSEIEKELIKYCRIQPTRDLYDEYQYIITTKIEELKIQSTSTGIYLRLKLFSELHDRNTGKLLWDNWECESSALKNDYSPSGSTNLGRVAGNSLQLIDLATISEDKLRNAINNAAREIANDMNKTLIQDLRKK